MHAVLGPRGPSGVVCLVDSCRVLYNSLQCWVGILSECVISRQLYSQLPACHAMPCPSLALDSAEALVWARHATQTVQQRQSLLQQRCDRLVAKSAEEREARLQQMSTQSPV